MQRGFSTSLAAPLVPGLGVTRDSLNKEQTMPIPNAIEASAINAEQLSTAFADLDAVLASLAGPFSTRSDFALARNIAQDKISALDAYVRRSFPAGQVAEWNAKLESTMLPTWDQVKP